MPKSQNESKFWKKLKSRIESSQYELTATRIENSQTPGIPDLLLLDHKKNLHLIELKVTQNARVNISPFQVSFATRHKGSRVWLLVRTSNERRSVSLSLSGQRRPTISGAQSRHG